MLISVAGSQGTGKSTTLSAAAEKFNLPIIQRKTSRSILSDWGVSLSDVNNSQELTIKFQDEIIKRKLEDEAEAVASDQIWLTERTFADLFVYATVALGKDNQYSDWLDQYFEQCKAAQRSYAAIVYLPAGFFKPVHDGVRGINVHYSRMVDLMLEDYTMQRMCCESSLAPYKVHSACLDVRLNIIEEVINQVRHGE